MRRVKWLLGIGFALLAAAPASAQLTNGFGGVNPLAIINQPVDTSQSVVPIARPQTLQSSGFSLKNILPKVGLPGAKVTHGTSKFPTQSGMPGVNYLQSFGFQRPKPVGQ